MEQYKYYSTQRPIDIGTYPNLPDNKPLKINRYDERRPVEGGQAKEFSQLIHYVDMMEKRLDLVNAELMEVQGELAGIKHSPVKQAITATITGIENGLQKTKKELAEIKEQIVETAAQAVESVKQTGLSALKKTLSFIGVKDLLKHLRGGLKSEVTL